MTPFPDLSDFMLAGIPLAVALDFRDRWPDMPELYRREIIHMLREQRGANANTTSH